MSTVADLPRNMQTKIVVRDTGQTFVPGPCWVWTGALNSRGYGCVGVQGKSQLTHRVTHELLIGPIPEDLQIDHVCRYKPCCNPEHIEPVTPTENMQRRPDINKDYCVNGHELTTDNLVIKARPDGLKIRNCRICKVQAQRDFRAKAKLTGLSEGDPRHGTLHGYRSFGCRCGPCKAVARAYRALRKPA